MSGLWQMNERGVWVPPPVGELPIPPSPPAEQGIRREREIRRQIVPLRCPGLSPVAWREFEQRTMPAARNSMTSLKPVAAAGGGIESMQDAAYYYKMDEASGNRADSTTNANDVAPTFSLSELGNTTGQVGNAAVCYSNPNTEYFTSATDAAYDFSGASVSYTLCAWAYALDASGNGGINCKGSGEFNGMEWRLIWLSATPTFRMTTGYVTGASEPVTWGATLSTSTWYFIEAGVDASASPNKVFISVNNGTRVTVNLVNDSGTNHDNGASYPFYIGEYDGVGASTPANAKFHGYVQHVGGWKRAWTSDERTAIWNSGSGQSVY